MGPNGTKWVKTGSKQVKNRAGMVNIGQSKIKIGKWVKMGPNSAKMGSKYVKIRQNGAKMGLKWGQNRAMIESK